VRAHRCCGIAYVPPSCCLCSNAPPTSLGNCVAIGRSQRYTVSHTFSVLGAHKNETIDVSTSKPPPPVPTNRTTISLINTKSCNALLHMLAVCIGSCLKSVLRDKYIILDTCHPYTLCLCGQGCEDLWSFFEDKRGSAKRRSLGNSDTDERWRAAIKPKAFSVLLDAYQGPPLDETLRYGYFGQATTASTSILCSLLYQTRKHCSRSRSESAAGTRALLIRSPNSMLSCFSNLHANAG
jgi:hypothetical protein